MGVSEPYEPGQPESASVVKAVERTGGESGGGGGGGGWFSGLRGAMSTRPGSGSDSRRGLPPPGTYKIGEVKAEYVKVSPDVHLCVVDKRTETVQNASGQYTLLSLIVDVPNSRAAYPGKAVVYWSPEADTEGLMSKRR